MNAEKEQLKKLNPRVTEVEIGVRELRTIKVWPLSAGQQLEASDIIAEALQRLALDEKLALDDVAASAFVVDVIKKNLPVILEFVLDEEERAEDVLNNIDNTQLVNLVEVIVQVNYLEPGKNVKSLSERMKQLFLSERPSPESLNGTQDTDLSTSSEEDTGKEESPSVN